MFYMDLRSDVDIRVTEVGHVVVHRNLNKMGYKKRADGKKVLPTIQRNL